MTTTQVDYAANLALWLIEKRGTTLATWGTRMTADQQRALFGRVLGKGTIVVDGERETICNRVSVCFGLDWDDRKVTAWRDL